MATFNRQHLLSRAIDSVLNQTYKNWELLIIDDGSQDDTKNFIENNFLFNNKIRYFERPHNGLAFSRNFGIKNSIGNFITFIDSDDEYKTNHIEIRIKFFENFPYVDLIHGGVEIIGPPESHYVKDKNDLNSKIHLDQCVIGATLFGRRRVFEMLNGFNNIYSEDSDFFERADPLFSSIKVGFQTYIYYRDTPDSILNNI